MTFIASVKARNGVAIIADSLVTTLTPVITVASFNKFLQEQDQQDINVQDILQLFEHQAHHTNDYEDKLVQFDKYTAVTTAGTANFGKYRISDMILHHAKEAAKDPKYSKATLQSKVDGFKKYAKKVIRESQESGKIDTDLVFTHYNTKSNQTEIIRAHVIAENIDTKWKIDIKTSEIPVQMKVCLNGQNGIAYNLLYGYALQAASLQQMFIEKFIHRSNMRISERRKKSILDELRSNIFKNFPELLDELKVFNLRELSIQEAVNLAYLLLKAEMDFQKYTQEIPTIGGVIKIATIDSTGYNIICGNDTISPV